jgi:hypothetical protein
MMWHHPTSARRSPSLAIRDGDWKLLMDPDGGRLELYNLSDDVSEKNNVATLHAEIVQRLKATLHGWYTELPTSQRRP